MQNYPDQYRIDLPASNRAPSDNPNDPNHILLPLPHHSSKSDDEKVHEYERLRDALL